MPVNERQLHRESHRASAGRAVTRLVSVPADLPAGDVDAKLLAWTGEGPDKDGFLRVQVELSAGATEHRSLSYRIEAASRVQLPF